MKRIHITTGDVDGIGLEVALKALHEILPMSSVQFVLWRSKGSSPCQPLLKDLIARGMPIRSLYHPEDLSNIETTKYAVIDIACSLNPTEWVVQAA